MRVLIVEDDRAMVGLLRKGLEEENHVVSAAYDGIACLELVKSHDYDVLVLDWMLPQMEGIEIIRRLRRDRCATPILMLTARDAIPDIVRGLDAGADDYIPKPFSFAVFLARLRALARRPATAPMQRVAVGDLMLDVESRRVFRGHHEIYLTPTEYRLLKFLMEASGRVASRFAIIEAVWGLDAPVEDNTLDAFVRLLRTKVDQGYDQKLIHTVRGFGYCLRPEESQ